MAVTVEQVRRLAERDLSAFSRLGGLRRGYEGLARALTDLDLAGTQLAFALLHRGNSVVSPCLVASTRELLVVSATKASIPQWDRTFAATHAQLAQYETYSYNLVGRGIRFQTGLDLAFNGRRGRAFVQALQLQLTVAPVVTAIDETIAVLNRTA